MSTPFDEVVTPDVIYQETASVDISTPASGNQTTFIDSADHRRKRKTSTGAVIDLEGHVYTSIPTDLQDNTIFFLDDLGSPATLMLYWRRDGVTHGPFPIGSTA